MSDEDFRWLLIDSCGITATLAVGSGDEVLAATELPGRGFSADWPGATRRLLVETGFGIEQLQFVAVVRGPGSFTGVRVGLAAAKGLCEAAGAKLIAVSRLEVLASLTDTGVLVVLDAGRDEFYVRDGDREMLLTRDELIASAQERTMITTDVLVKKMLVEALIVELDAVSALPIVIRRWRRGMFDDVALVDANYVRGERDIYARKQSVNDSEK